MSLERDISDLESKAEHLQQQIWSSSHDQEQSAKDLERRLAKAEYQLGFALGEIQILHDRLESIDKILTRLDPP